MDGEKAQSLLTALDWADLGEQIRLQQRNREVHTPAISTFRWWARRSHALIGALLDSAMGDFGASCVGDPFSGGGTVAIEAARRGADVFAQDLHPWVIAGLGTTLRPVDPDELEEAAQGLMQRLDPLRSDLYRADCRDHPGESEVLTAFWVRVAHCPDCSENVYLYPYSLVTRASRARDESLAWWGCGACGTVSQIAAGSPRLCSGCEAVLGDGDVSLLPGREASCPHPGCGTGFRPFEQSPGWKLVLVQRLCTIQGRQAVHFSVPTEAEAIAAESAEKTPGVSSALGEPIPSGMETRVLRRCGFRNWSDLYAPRQLRVLTEASKAIDSANVSAAIRDRLRLALCGCAEMAGHVSRWDRYYPKAFEAMANHRFAVTGFSCETNLLAERGRGTLARRLGHSVDAARWAQEEIPRPTDVSRRRSSAGARVKPGGVVLTEGSSERQRASTGSIDLILTDPPYFDDIQYAELASVFLAWARASGLVPESVELDLGAEAVANPERGVDADRYRELLTAILSETNRTISADGRMVLTFHNSDLRAWWALGWALREAGFAIAALAVIHSENEKDHAKRGKLAFTRDLVIECFVDDGSGGGKRGEPVLAWYPNDDEAKELIAAGRAMAMIPQKEEFASFRERFCGLRGPLSSMRISPRQKVAAR